MKFFYGFMAFLGFLMACAAMSDHEWPAVAVLGVSTAWLFFRMERA